MGIHVLLGILLIFVSKSQSSNFPIAKPNCSDHCGNTPIPFPFGLTENCYLNIFFSITCNETTNPPKAFLINSTIEISDILLEDGQLRILQFLAHDCYSKNATLVSRSNPWIELPSHYTVSNTANKFTIIGCDTYGYVSGTRLNRNYTTGCTATCDALDDLSEGSCTGLGCCQTSIPKEVSFVGMELYSYDNYTYVRDFNNCSYAFLVEESAFSFSPANLSNLKNVEKLPMMVDWAIGNETCQEGQKNLNTYACKSNNSGCYSPNNDYGYRCYCQKGYRGNPYLPHGCQDIDECKDPNLNNCEKHCENKQGSYKCSCPKGYRGDGKKDGRGCFRDKSFEFELVSGLAIGFIALIFMGGWIYFELRRRKLTRMKKTFFFQNGGMLLQQKLINRDKSPHMAKIFTSTELKKATNNFHNNMIIGQGGFGTVYKGDLPNNKIVAIKKSKEVDPSQIEQFINEVLILSHINHRNIVRLLGCCLETQVPLLVYEFIENGTLFENIHIKAKARFLDWKTRLRIAAETAGVLSYLHSAVSTPIIHRDFKSANILLDASFTAKVSDFGASRLIPMDQTQLSTMVQGTFGYLDPEYMQTNQLTEKSDVYSFGVVLAELLTGRKALSFDCPEEERNLANHFIYMLRRERLFEILEENVVCEEYKEQLIEVAKLAQRCLNVKGEDRPSMKEVAMILDGLRLGRKRGTIENEENVQERESLYDEELNSIAFDNGYSGSISWI